MVFNGVDNSPSDKPKITYAVAQHWIQSQRLAGAYLARPASLPGNMRVIGCTFSWLSITHTVNSSPV